MMLLVLAYRWNSALKAKITFPTTLGWGGRKGGALQAAEKLAGTVILRSRWRRRI
jgi:hypothetical protein